LAQIWWRLLELQHVYFATRAKKDGKIVWDYFAVLAIILPLIWILFCLRLENSLTCEGSCPNFENFCPNNGQFFSIGDVTASPASPCHMLMLVANWISIDFTKQFQYVKAIKRSKLVFCTFRAVRAYNSKYSVYDSRNLSMETECTLTQLILCNENIYIFSAEYIHSNKVSELGLSCITTAKILNSVAGGITDNGRKRPRTLHNSRNWR